MPSSVCLSMRTTTGAGEGGSASPFVPSLSRIGPPSQLGRSQIWRASPTLRYRASHRRTAFVCETAVEIDGMPSTEGIDGATPAVGSRIRVCKPVKVYHVPKHPEFDLSGSEGELKDVLKSWKGKPLSANLPYKVQFVLDVEGKQVKFFAHLKEGEFEVI